MNVLFDLVLVSLLTLHFPTYSIIRQRCKQNKIFQKEVDHDSQKSVISREKPKISKPKANKTTERRLKINTQKMSHIKQDSRQQSFYLSLDLPLLPAG